METKHQLRDDTIEGLQELVKMNYDACEGYQLAAEETGFVSTADFFRQGAASRQRFTTELSDALRTAGAEVPDSGTLKGSVHRTWTKFRDMLSGSDAKALVSEAIRGESSLIDSYEEVLKDTAGSPYNKALHQQLTEVKDMKRSLEALEESL